MSSHKTEKNKCFYRTIVTVFIYFSPCVHTTLKRKSFLLPLGNTQDRLARNRLNMRPPDVRPQSLFEGCAPRTGRRQQVGHQSVEITIATCYQNVSADGGAKVGASVYIQVLCLALKLSIEPLKTCLQHVNYI